MKGYFAIDLIVDKDDQIIILDPHGFGDAISFSERAGYTPRKDRVHRCMRLWNERASGKNIVYIIGNDKQYILSDDVKKFYDELPKGIAHLEWIDAEIAREKTLTPNIMKAEMLFFDQAARAIKAKFHPGWLVKYDDKLVINEFYIRTMTQLGQEISYNDIGLVINWGSNHFLHPDHPMYWRGNPIDIPVMNGPQADYIFSSAPKSIRMDVLNMFTTNLPDDIYIGMARSSSDKIADFIDKYDSFVYKPLFTHGGIDVRFLSKSQAIQLSKMEKPLDSLHKDINDKIDVATRKGFKYQKDCFNGYFFNKKGHCAIPIRDMGSYVLQERINPQPFRSVKTQKKHTGTIRAQVLFGEPLGVMHRFSTDEYNGEFQDITKKDVRTFWERTDSKLEQKIMDFLTPLLTSVENEIEKHPSAAFFQ